MEKLFSSWICWKAPTGGSFNTSWSYARPYGIIRHISSVPGSGRTPSERLHDYLRAFYHVFMGKPTLYNIDDFDGVNEEKRHVVKSCFLGPPCRAIYLGPHSKIQLCPEGLARADALGLFVSLQRPRFLRRLSA